MLYSFTPIEFFATCFLTGLIWFVQIVHYPSFSGWNPLTFTQQHERHCRTTGYVVAPVMLLELLSSFMILLSPPPSRQSTALLGFALVILIWILTFFRMVPLHDRLRSGFHPAVHQSLLRWNWARTVAWTLRAVLVASAFISPR